MLHIGNIANNAFNNAKLLNQTGLDCDVICSDYYHIMGCPEWEDADFDGELRNQFRPDWTAVDLRGFIRPNWFAQGPLHLCLDYLIAKRSENLDEASKLWRRLGYANKTREIPWTQYPTELWSRLKVIARRVFWAALSCETVARKLDEWTHRFGQRFRIGRYVLPNLSNVAKFFFVSCSRILLTCYVTLFRYFVMSDLPRLTAELRHRFETSFPDRSDRLSMEDLIFHINRLAQWRELLKHYDIVQAYAIEPIVPCLVGHAYFAFEHGTLREIPTWENRVGRLTTLSYHEAAHVFVTNTDCIENTKSLVGDNFTFINHPYDEDHSLDVDGWQKVREDTKAALQADFLFFFPTRHDWVAGTGFADKANDVFLHAFGRLRKMGYPVGLVCCQWGRNVNESMRLIERLECVPFVRWTQPMGMVRFERMVKACEVVVDQFKLGSFGGVTFKALAAGAAVCTHLDNVQLSESFGEPPPVLNCRTEEEIVAAMGDVLEYPSRREELSRSARAWIKKYHGSAQVVAAQLEAYGNVLGANEIVAPTPHSFPAN